jgi:aspartyl-tRNA(Asn)/glutamyl-tRNA(Gln) amidotransferase subunit A
MTGSPYCLSIRELRLRYRSGKISPVEVARAFLELVDEQEGKLNAWITVRHEKTLAEAQRAERDFKAEGKVDPLQGIPLALKDNMDTAGLRTTCASRIMADHVPDRDATVVRKLGEAGAIILGKNNLLEFAYGIVHPDFGQCNNPWDPTRTAGGSSSGGAASVAAGQVYAALGTDTGGSIRIPASYCGIVGFKPTYGLVSRYGVFPLSWSLDHVGPLARTVEDAAIVLAAIAGRDPNDPTSIDTPSDLNPNALDEFSLDGVKIGLIPQHLGDDLRPTVRKTFDEAVDVFKKAGAQIRDVNIPDIMQCDEALFPLIAPEATFIHEKWLRERPEDYAPMTRKQLEMGLEISAVDFVRWQQFRNRLIEQFREAFKEVDVIISPTVAWVAPKEDPAVMGDEGVIEARRTAPYNITGMPAITVPCGFAEGDLPAGLQIAGPWLRDQLVLQVARAYEKIGPWKVQVPRGVAD